MQHLRFASLVFVSTNLVLIPWLTILRGAEVTLPVVKDSRLEIRLFADSHQIVHPIGVAHDANGRILAIESHTHFPPEGYQGLKHDRILMLEDVDGDGRADKVTTFYEGLRHSMDIAVHFDGSIYVATRNEIVRLVDTDNDGRADEKTQIVFMETNGTYPHNGLSGLHFDFAGNLTFGMGENLGVAYTLRGTDGTEISDEAEGGNVFWCTRDGKQLKRIATGFWNPFGICSDIHGRLFAVDNDPAANGCRVLHVVAGGDYGYQYRYGRSGLHPFISWRGQMPGTLPMACYVGEAPCELICYEDNGLPTEYRGRFLTACWGEHRIEAITMIPQASTFRGQRSSLVQGNSEFRPVGISVAPDGSLFISDWVRRDYKLHGHGRIWQLRQKETATAKTRSPKNTVNSPKRTVREASVRKLLAAGRVAEVESLARSASDDRILATALTGLLTVAPESSVVREIAASKSAAFRAQILRHLMRSGHLDLAAQLADRNQVSSELARLTIATLPAGKQSEGHLIRCLQGKDPFQFSAAINWLAKSDNAESRDNLMQHTDPAVRVGVLVACQRSVPPPIDKLPTFLQDPAEIVRFLALKWIADQKLDKHSAWVNQKLNQDTVSPREFIALATAQARLEGRPANEAKIFAGLTNRLFQADTPAALKASILRGTPTPAERGRSAKSKLKLERVQKLLDENSGLLREETVRYLIARAEPDSAKILATFGRQASPPGLRSLALVGLAGHTQQHADDLIAAAADSNSTVANEALRVLVDAELDKQQQTKLQRIAIKFSNRKELVTRVITPDWQPSGRPPENDIDAWLTLTDGVGDPRVGARIFSNTSLGRCSTCHIRSGRGAQIGPDLSDVARQSDRRRILESLLRPNLHVDPHYAAWRILTNDGKTYTGFLLSQTEQDQTYLEATGRVFTLANHSVESVSVLNSSVMPEGLLRKLTDQEIRDLLAYLLSHN